MPTDAPPWVPLSTPAQPTSEFFDPLEARTAGLARVQHDLEGLLAIAVPGLGTVGQFVTGAWAWCPNGPELPRAVMLAWGLSLPPAPGIGKAVDALLDGLEPTAATVPQPQWGAPAEGRAGESVWSADLAHPLERPGQVVVEAPSGTVLTMWRRGWPVDLGGTITVLAPGWDPRGRLPEVLAQAEVARTRPVSLPSAGSAALDDLRRRLGGRDWPSAATGADPGRFAELAQLPADRVHPRAAGVFRLAPVVGDWWPPAAERTRPTPQATTSSTRTRSRSRGNAGKASRRRPRRGGRGLPVLLRPRSGPPATSFSPTSTPTRSRAVIPTLFAATFVAFAIALTFTISIAAGRIAPDAGAVLTVFALGLVLGPILTIAGIVNLARHRPRIVVGRWLLGVGFAGIELFFALWLIGQQAGEKVF